jgi:hypothetical protein
VILIAVAAALLSEAMSPSYPTVGPRELAARLRGGWPVVLFSIALVVGVLRGVLGGGDMYMGMGSCVSSCTSPRATSSRAPRCERPSTWRVS